MAKGTSTTARLTRSGNSYRTELDGLFFRISKTVVCGKVRWYVQSASAPDARCDDTPVYDKAYYAREARMEAIVGPLPSTTTRKALIDLLIAAVQAN